MLTAISYVLNDYTLRTVLMGTIILGITSGVLGCFALLRQQSLLGDAVSHASLPGIALIFLCTHTTHPAVLLFGGAVAGFIGAVLINVITASTTLKRDAALGIVLSVFFGIGLVLLTVIQKQPIGQQAILNKFLFGNASTLILSDVWVMLVIGVTALATTALFFKELALFSFDPTYARSRGYSLLFLESLLTVLLVLSIVIGLQTVGVVLMSTMFIAPAAAARQWSSSLTGMILLAGLFGALSSVTGTLISSCVGQLPTGPTIVVVMSGIVFFSLLCAPGRGFIWKKIVGK